MQWIFINYFAFSCKSLLKNMMANGATLNQWCTYSSHVFTDPEFFNCNCFFKKKGFSITNSSNCVILEFILRWKSIYINNYNRSKQTTIFRGKKSGFVWSDFVKTCDELVIGHYPQQHLWHHSWLYGPSLC